MQQTVLLTGVTGYVGGRLLPLLEQRGVRLRCLARRPEFMTGRVRSGTEIVQGDVFDPESLQAAMQGVETAYYLVHSLGATRDFAAEDRLGALNFAEAARSCGVKRIIYLGGLGDSQEKLSKHLRSRQETGDVLRSTGIEVLEFRASIVIGSGSLSFELIRTLTERLPVMICPRWVSTMAQPIAIEDILAYLMKGLDVPLSGSQIFEIGGPDQASYADIIREYARQRGLRRRLIRVPLLTPRLSSLWLGLVSPVYARVGRKLIESLRNPTVVRDDSATSAFDVRPLPLSDAISRALRNEDQEFMATKWSDAMSVCRSAPKWGGLRFGNRLVDSRQITVSAAPAEAFAPIRRIGGKRGWYFATFLWRLRGFLDLLCGGAGLRRGRRDPEQLRVGDAVDFWRVEEYEPNHLLRLAAEMRLPGRAWLEFEVSGDGQQSVIRQTAVFDPIGLSGIAYWYLIYPLHYAVFTGMLRSIAHLAVDNKPGTSDGHDSQPGGR